jgi:hypothetical protein
LDVRSEKVVPRFIPPHPRETITRDKHYRPYIRILKGGFPLKWDFTEKVALPFILKNFSSALDKDYIHL